MKKKAFTALMLLVAALTLNAQLLYKISGNGLNKPSYIVGTYHMASATFVDSIAGIKQAMDDCQQVYGEIAMNDMFNADSLAMMQQAMMLPEGMTIDKLLTADEMSRLNSYLRELMGTDMTNPMVAQQMGSLTPDALSTTLTLMSYAAKSGTFVMENMLDQYFQNEALAQGKSVGGLETMAFEIKVLYGSKSLERQKELLMCLVDNAEFNDELADEVIKAYYSQDIEAVGAAMNKRLYSSCDPTPDEEALLIDNRNADWLTKMPAIMAEKPTFFAVGAGHLPGKKGVLNLLRQAGYTVDPVK